MASKQCLTERRANEWLWECSNVLRQRLKAIAIKVDPKHVNQFPCVEDSSVARPIWTDPNNPMPEDFYTRIVYGEHSPRWGDAEIRATMLETIARVVSAVAQICAKHDVVPAIHLFSVGKGKNFQADEIECWNSLRGASGVGCVIGESGVKYSCHSRLYNGKRAFWPSNIPREWEDPHDLLMRGEVLLIATFDEYIPALCAEISTYLHGERTRQKS